MTELPSPLRGDAVDLPAVRERSNKGLKQFVEDSKAAELREERRLAYVAVTRPRQTLVVSCHWWGPEQKQPRGPSVFMDDVTAAMHSWGDAPEVATPPPDVDSGNPANRSLERYSWPVEAGADEVAQRRAAAALVDEARAAGPVQAAMDADDDLMLDELTRVDQWDREIRRLVEEVQVSRANEIVVRLPDQPVCHDVAAAQPRS
ncbi:MAG: 3'-5' exonuclease [Nocardioidaceae bacterium]